MHKTRSVINDALTKKAAYEAAFFVMSSQQFLVTAKFVHLFFESFLKLLVVVINSQTFILR